VQISVLERAQECVYTNDAAAGGAGVPYTSKALAALARMGRSAFSTTMH